ncbi:Uncharacterized conserved protein [Janthinobacterium sp. Marseille]|nr:hypothetical protein [Janthinobacterium sp. Marseille]ABR88617.1 Uncharacterized conserved protein [Janthinobacterium sp. Marseille]
MNITSVNSTATALPATAQAEEGIATQAGSESSGETNQKPASTRVTLSSLGQALAAKRQAAMQPVRNQDIDSSNVPDNIKDLLKRIRELKEQIAEQQQKLNAIMANQRLSPEEKQKQLLQVQSTISALNGALTSALGQMNKLMREQDLTQDQQMAVASLLAV